MNDAHRKLSGRVVIATHNPGKLREMRELLAPYGIEAVSAGDLGLIEPDETGLTFLRRKSPACLRLPTIPAFASMRWVAIRAFIRRAGPKRRAILPPPWPMCMN